MRFLQNVPNLIFSVRFPGCSKTCKSFKVHEKLRPQNHFVRLQKGVTAQLPFSHFSELLLRLLYLVLLSASHHVDEEIYAALVDDGHAVQESYFICKRRGAKNEDRKVPL